MRLTHDPLATLTSVDVTYALQFTVTLMSPPKYPAPGLFFFCGFPAWSQKTTDCVTPGNHTASSVKLTSLSDVTSEKFHLKLGFLVIDMILTLYLFQLKVCIFKNQACPKFLSSSQVDSLVKWLYIFFIKSQICWKHLPVTVVIPEDAKPQTLLS